TLGSDYVLWSISAVHRKLGSMDDYQLFSKRALSYQNIFDSKSGFMRARNSDGTWAEPFDPYLSEHDTKKAHYMEGNAWQHSFFVPHDVRGLQALYGGDGLEQKLDSLFSVRSTITGQNARPDVSGMMGQY